jgi:hypothetical protein
MYVTLTVAASVIATMGDVTQICSTRYLDIQGKFNYCLCLCSLTGGLAVHLANANESLKLTLITLY